ncbi:MAG: hypothetical protein QM726_03370 [Chitinophagaceae bacterium]
MKFGVEYQQKKLVSENKSAMTIIFICGCLEPGHDGVGDYTRKLALELTKQGHRAGAIAINDRFVNNIADELQCESSLSIPVLRLPASIPGTQNFDIAKKWVDSFNPEWMSLQYVPFAFHPKGLRLGLGKQLHQLGKGRKWHIMFHELWVGMNKESSQKYFYWGQVQRQLISSMIARLKPLIVHTQTQVYLAQLKKINVNAAYLPLFSNIPVASMPVMSGNRRSTEFVFFGSIHPNIAVEDFATEAVAYAASRGEKPVLKIIGRSGSEQQRWQSIFTTAGFEVKVLGEKKPEEVSAILASPGIGLSTTTLLMAEKSGSIAALSAHGLPVLCVTHAWSARGLKAVAPVAGITEYKKGMLQSYLDGPLPVAQSHAVPAIAKQFADNLNNN